MTENESQGSIPKGIIWTGRIISAIPALMMGLGSLVMLFRFDQAVKQMGNYHYPTAALRYVMIAAVLSALLYAIPQTAVLGAILLTGYLGGAVATHVQAGEFTQVPFPIFFGGLVWLGLYLRDARIRRLVPLRAKFFRAA